LKAELLFPQGIVRSGQTLSTYTLNIGVYLSDLQQTAEIRYGH
jgi:hypothetical protein